MSHLEALYLGVLSSQKINQSRFNMQYHLLDLVLTLYGMAVAGSAPHKQIGTVLILQGISPLFCKDQQGSGLQVSAGQLRFAVGYFLCFVLLDFCAPRR